MNINKTTIAITPPAPFDFCGNAYSHGWSVLAPNSWDKENGRLHRTERLADGTVVLLDVSGSGSIQKPQMEVRVQYPGRLSTKHRAEIVNNIERMFRFDEDFRSFYRLCRKQGGRWRKTTQGLGRLLRSPSVFEDMVKTICTTNIQWGGTIGMVQRIVEAYGLPFAGDSVRRTFPQPEAIAAVELQEFSAKVRLGYRAPYVHALAVNAASGKLDLEGFMDDSLPTPELKKRLLALKGVGHYAAATMLMLLGRYDELPVDSVFRQFVRTKYFPKKNPSDQEGAAIYTSWNEWKYLAYWFDIRSG